MSADPLDKQLVEAVLSRPRREARHAVIVPGALRGHPRELDPEALLIELEDDQLRERSDYNEAAQAEAERAGDTDTIERLLLERRQINEARRSLDRRREDTRLFARPTVAVHS